MIKSAMAKTETGMATLREIANDVFSRYASQDYFPVTPS